MIKISTYRQTYEIPFHIDYECNFGIYARTNGDIIMRFHTDERSTPWSEDMNENTIFSFSVNEGMKHRSLSLSTEMNGIFLDIIDMIQDEYNKLQLISDHYNHNDAHHNVLTEHIVKYMRERKIKSLVE